MELPKHSNPTKTSRKAKAPYNFVPLPEQIIIIEEEPPLMDRYHPDRYSGWLDCTLTNDSPLYIRAGLTEEEALSTTDKVKAEFFSFDPHNRRPVIPASSLRGMFRTLIEIITYSKVQPVTDKYKIFFRAVAAPKDDPLARPYQQVMGRYGRNVKAGYVERHGERWYVRPARHPRDLGFSQKEAYLKIKHSTIENSNIPNFIPFTDKNYRPQYHKVSFDIDHSKAVISRIGPDGEHQYKGMLICSGNMSETSSSSQKGRPKDQKGRSPRTHCALVLEPIANKRPLPIQEQAIRDYVDSLTDFQKQSPPFHKQRGCLIEGHPIFYVEEKGEVIAFGHTPYFRIPAWVHGSSPKRAATPLDFVPLSLRNLEKTDITEALFGYADPMKTDKRDITRPGRIFFSDGHCIAHCEAGDSIVPPILSSPKPTAFQHYLVQDQKRGHDPDKKETLAHYGTPTPQETVIRGHKLYWHKGEITVEEIMEKPKENQEQLMRKIENGNDTQHTIIQPLKAGATFSFRIDFENLREEELGALLWILQIADDDQYRLKLGMGKPLGMGAVKITSTLHIIDRRKRYQTLFENDRWAIGEQSNTQEIQDKSLHAFEQMLLSQVGSDTTSKIEDIPRIKELLTILSWPGPDRELTRYLEIEHPENGNEYKNRPVLPRPTSVENEKDLSSPHDHGKSGSQNIAKQGPSLSRTTKPCREENLKHPQDESEIEKGDCLKGKLVRLTEKQAIISLGVSQGTIKPEEIDKAFRRHSALEDIRWANIIEDSSLRKMIESYQYPLLVKVVRRKKGTSKSPWQLQFIRWIEESDKE